MFLILISIWFSPLVMRPQLKSKSDARIIASNYTPFHNFEFNFKHLFTQNFLI
jgi:hypothetical protein